MIPVRASPFWTQATDSEIYGNLIYYNGWDSPDRSHGHGIYTQNRTGTKRVVDNIFFQHFSQGYQTYGSATAFLDNFCLEGNACFKTDRSTADNRRNFLIGGGSDCQ